MTTAFSELLSSESRVCVHKESEWELSATFPGVTSILTAVRLVRVWLCERELCAICPEDKGPNYGGEWLYFKDRILMHPLILLFRPA